MKKRLHQAVEWFGWVGVFAIFCAYAGLNVGLMASEELTYQLLNLIGGLLILIDAWVDRNYQPVALNALWSLIALIAIFRSFL